MTPPRTLAALALLVAGVALSHPAQAEDTYVITEGGEDVAEVRAGSGEPGEDNPLVVLCKADAERCRELLAQRMDLLRRLIEEERAGAARGAVPRLGEASKLANALASPRLSQAADAPSPAVRLAWLAHRHRWVHPIPTELSDAVAKAWASPHLTSDDRSVLADAAMTLGHTDALDLLVSRLTGPGPAPRETVVGAPPPADWLLRRHTDAPRRADSSAALAQWFGVHRDALAFDPFLRRWRVAKRR